MNEPFDYTPSNDLPLYGVQFTQATARPTPAKSPKKLSLLAFLSALLAPLSFLLYPLLPIVFAVVSIVLACIAKKRNGRKMPGLARAGLIISIVTLVLLVVLMTIGIVVLVQEYQADPNGFLDRLFEEAYGVSYDEFMEQMLPPVEGDAIE